ncbi:MAG: hypothetical protein ACYC99_02670 [Candidatus Geothermincolia bacterium]
MTRKYSELPPEEKGPETPDKGGPYKKSAPIKVSFGVYIISLIVVALAVFIIMLVQYLPGYRSNYKVSQAIKNSNVTMSITIPMAETEKRKENPFTKDQRDKLASVLKGMGAKTVTVKIQPE